METRDLRRLIISPMTAADIDEVMAVEGASFSVPWTRGMFEDEMANDCAFYFTARENGLLVGYCGMWHVVNEGHITNVAVAPEARRAGVGRALLGRLVELAVEKEMMGMTLEVRVGNVPAMGLYAKFGFKPEGIRKNYYADTGDDAVIMWKYFKGNE